jgi:hypothetical protein
LLRWLLLVLVTLSILVAIPLATVFAAPRFGAPVLSSTLPMPFAMLYDMDLTIGVITVSKTALASVV